MCENTYSSVNSEKKGGGVHNLSLKKQTVKEILALQVKV